MYSASMPRSTLIAPSILGADLGRLCEEIAEVEACGADYIHVDVMDGHFVPNISWGAPIVRAARAATRLPLDVHLMISDPARYIDDFADAGADIIGIHVEADRHAQRSLTYIRSLGKKASLTLNPQTGLETLDYLLDAVDQILVMSVNPGFGGQQFLPQVLPKIEKLRQRIDQLGLTIDIEVDGGVNEDTAPLVRAAGANILVAGAAIFSRPDRKKSIATLRGKLG